MLISILKRYFAPRFLHSGISTARSKTWHAAPDDGLDEVRWHMLSLGVDLPTRDRDALIHRLASARTLAELWAVRTDLYCMVSYIHGADEARRRTAELKCIFRARLQRDHEVAPRP